jgi:hypothetical protein
LQNKHQRGIPDDKRPYSRQSAESRSTFVPLANSDICKNEYAKYNLEAPVDDALSCHNDYHEEHHECKQDHELLPHVLKDLPEMIKPRISLLEVSRRISSILCN